MREPYRTVLGHFRHEVGHYYWDRLVHDRGMIERCRQLFGDKTQDYGEALKRHYDLGAPADWQNAFISSYATAHPWEDFAETWAHYIHMVDGLETALAFGVDVRARRRNADSQDVNGTFEPYTAASAQVLVDAWIPLTIAINSVNRSMGQPDLYPFVAHRRSSTSCDSFFMRSFTPKRQALERRSGWPSVSELARHALDALAEASRLNWL